MISFVDYFKNSYFEICFVLVCCDLCIIWIDFSYKWVDSVI